MKILWASNAPWAPTGYGQQTSLMLPRLRDAGHEVAVAANYGLQGAMSAWDDFVIYPTGANYSADTLAAHAEDWFRGEPGWIIVLYDAWTIHSPTLKEHNVAVWCPVDHRPTPPLVRNHFEVHGSVPIAMSRFGEEQLRLDGLDPLYAPHGIDTSLLRPHSTGEAKQRLGLDPDRFLVGMVSTNNCPTTPIRKAFPEAFAAFSLLHRDHPDSLLYVHAEHTGNMNGINLEVLATVRGVPPEALVFADEHQYRTKPIGTEQMGWLYSAFDVLLFPSMGEGFGIPAVEAQACGTPVIVSDFAAQPELVGVGLTTAAQPFYDPEQRSDFCLPSIRDLYQNLTFCYDNRASLDDGAIACREFALRYDADTVFAEHWVPTLAELESRLPSTEPISL